MEDFIYWIWLQNALGYGSNKVSKIFSKINSIKDFYHSGFGFWNSLKIFNDKELYKLSSNLDSSERIYGKCCKLGYDIVPYESINYPDILKQISNPPCVIYVNGQLSVLKNKCISIVGSREASVYGVQMAEEIARDLSNVGITIVSGCAFGIDSAAHRGAMSAKGTTIGVVACGLDYPYLVKNASIREQISNFGALISEYPPGYEIRKYNFPTRNRIISGLSFSTIIIEAKERSGAIITANIAADQGRDVFVVPVNFNSPLSKGINSLIEDGVKVITSADDIIKGSDLYKIDRSKTINKFQKDNKRRISKELPEKFKLILNAIGNKKIHVNNLKEILKVPISDLLISLTKMELSGLIVQLPGKFYKVSIEKNKY